jgi:hypothetical protein
VLGIGEGEDLRLGESPRDVFQELQSIAMAKGEIE